MFLIYKNKNIMFIELSYKESIFKTVSKSGKVFDKIRKRKVYHLVCDNCQIEFERNSSEFSSKRANNKYKHFCNKCGSASGFAGKVGSISVKNKQESLMGSKLIDSSGYVSLYVGPNYEYKNTYGGRIREHIYLIQKKIGRQLYKNEVVHHIDDDKTNNNIDNLDLCTATEHNNCHAKIEKIVFELYKQGIVGYDKLEKRYYLNSLTR